MSALIERVNNMNTFKMQEKTLTEIEAWGLKSKHDLANGHASHELTLSQQCIISQLPELWESGRKQTSHDAEEMFKWAFQQLANTPSLKYYAYFKICPTASNSIDMVAAWLAQNKLKTALLEPTFDNLYLILKRRGVMLKSLPEEELTDKANFPKNIDAIFLINPNNPTGKVFSFEYLKNVIKWCAENKKILILDHSFRFFVPQLFDIYQALIDEKITFIGIEDTGKVWPTQEIKASLLCCSKDIFAELAIIYDEIFLCHSNFALQLLTEFLTNAHYLGLHETVWKEVACRRAQFRAVLDEEMLFIPSSSLTSRLSVEWVQVGKYFVNDVSLVSYLQASHLTVLPGRQFYWDRKKSFTGDHFVRCALLKPEQTFLNALDAIKLILSRLKG